ncbi:MarR family transcriptional regulator [Listeria weihenstephanensis FSL R9-0317]|uniref:MarR family transcriptional regulator n=1 Tax=Listeria weihenstephanensis TaxID=1006155 RepID=A0A1S7FS81_9LIST|nr:MarR family transcriptional regulator [Listeria weihenstephanensis]AQY50260.1 MarR family transcriptional regulator [Listeria weihenstephanensis]EUJ40870.1 MarR family transcriptional regulator [Listeria weihenstephanensis FSL R9-0317]MBC1500778.1 MarR family transcriptional regulator [Listeria weihenstephanensis]
MQNSGEDLGQSVVKAFMNFKRAELQNFKVPGLKRSETRFLFMLHHGLQHKQDKLGMKVADVTAILKVSKPSVTQQINALEEKKLIIRSQDPVDKRAAYIRLTKEGESVVEEIISTFHKNFEDMTSFLGKEEMERLISLLDKLTEYLNTKAENEEV